MQSEEHLDPHPSQSHGCCQVKMHQCSAFPAHAATSTHEACCVVKQLLHGCAYRSASKINHGPSINVFKGCVSLVDPHVVSILEIRTDFFSNAPADCDRHREQKLCCQVGACGILLQLYLWVLEGFDSLRNQGIPYATFACSQYNRGNSLQQALTCRRLLSSFSFIAQLRATILSRQLCCSSFPARRLGGAC